MKQQEFGLKKASHQSVEAYNVLPDICVTFYASVKNMRCLLPSTEVGQTSRE